MLIFIASLVILIATSPSDIAAVDTKLVSATLDKNQEQVRFRFDYTNGPFDFENLPLIINIEVNHAELNENFDFKDQSWVMSTATLAGEELKTRTLLRRGKDGVLTVDYGDFRLFGTTSLYSCNSMIDQEAQDDACIPCSSEDDRCSFSFTLIREGAPYPAETVEIQASQWLVDKSSAVQLEVSLD